MGVGPDGRFGRESRRGGRRAQDTQAGRGLLTSNPTDALPSTTGHVPQPSHPVNRIRTAAALLPLLLLTGCFQLRALVRVAEDGSGTMEETVLFGAMVREMMAASGETPAIADLYHVDSLRAHAAKLAAEGRLPADVRLA